MTPKTFNLAASMVRSILHGEWTFDTPAWAGPTLQPYEFAEYELNVYDDLTVGALNYTRAVWTAEAFIMFFSATQDRFNAERFLIACGLKEKARKAS